MSEKEVRHILGISGGKDSTALALYLKYRVPQVEYFFCDTHKELPETYEYIEKLEMLLGKEIVRLEDNRGFDHWIGVYDGFLPNPKSRWCTKKLKIEPLERFIGGDDAISYIAIRGDEDRAGYVSTKPNIKPVFPFIIDGLVKRDIFKIIEESGIGMPDYYNWRSRSGCYFCFFQRKIEWVRLSEVHPDLFEKAIRYEQDHGDGRKYYWNQEESLQELVERKDQIIADYHRLMNQKKKDLPNRPLIEVFDAVLDDENKDFCFVCNL